MAQGSGDRMPIPNEQRFGSDTVGPQRHLDPGDTWTPKTLGPREHLDPGDTWTPGTLGPQGHLDPGDIWTPGTLGPRGHLDPGHLDPETLGPREFSWFVR